MLIAGIFFIIGTILNAAAINFLMLVLGRLMLGCSVGFANQVNPEASTPIYSLRGLDNFKFFSLSFYWY
uniref:Major facilitator superfamily (MFS) profile domain-containing protein n=1 Tax=Cannabis sativa TaxID=3483 RepID=A0A803R7I1_CANSA